MSTIVNGRTEPPLRIFLSYAAADRPYARRLESLLRGAERQVLTTEGFSAGEDWATKLRGAIAQSDVFVVLVSPSSVESTWVLHELGAAWALDKPIIPVLTQPDLWTRIPLELSSAQTVDLKALESPEMVQQLLAPYERHSLGSPN